LTADDAMLDRVLQNPVIDVLAKQSAAKLEAMQKDIEAQITDLRTQARWVDRALVEKGIHPAHDEENLEPSAPATPAPAKIKRRGQKKTGTADAIRAVISERPEHVWKPAEVIKAVKARGVPSSDQAIRVALRRMHKVEHFLERGPDGTGWRLASSNGSRQESFSAEISGPTLNTSERSPAYG